MINITLIKLKFNHNKRIIIIFKIKSLNNKIVNYNWIHFNISIINRREVEVDMEKCKKRNTEHCTKSKFCAKRNRSKIYRL